MHVQGKIILIAATFVATNIGYGTPISANSDDPRAKLVSLISSADQLYNGAALIVAKHPTTQGAVDIIFDTVGKQWQNDENAFQDSLASLEKYSALPDDVSHGVVRLGQFDSLIFEAVGDVYDCDDPAANADLKIAQEILAHAQMAAKGKPDPKWNPDDLLTNPVDSAACQ
jgi:threonine dehydrogenase-like Zn-dependent dehydrogenase